MNASVIFEHLFETYPALIPMREDIKQAFILLHDCYAHNAKTMICGNGGSAADSEHIVGELMKGFNLKRPLTETQCCAFEKIDGGTEIARGLQNALPAISLVSHTGLLSAFANDCDPSLVFAQQVWGYAQKNDVLLALSTSGNSRNVVNAVKTAKAAGIRSIAMTGSKESALSRLCDVTIRLPAQSPYEVQEFTLPVYHALCAMLESSFFRT